MRSVIHSFDLTKVSVNDLHDVNDLNQPIRSLMYTLTA